MWNMAFTVAIPLIMSAYVCLVGKAARIVREGAPGKPADGYLPYILGEMETALATPKTDYEGVAAIAGNLHFEPVTENADAIAKRKSEVAKTVM